MTQINRREEVEVCEGGKTGFPRKIWAAWHQGLENAPEHVRAIIDLWRDLNPNYDLTVFTEPEVSDILREEGVEPSHLTPQVKANLLRSLMLKRHGGVWIDVTLLPTQSLDRWLFPIMEEAKFFAFTSSGDPDLVLQNWFLASRPNSVLMRRWCDFYFSYFRSPRSLHSWKKALVFFKMVSFIRYIQFNKCNQRTWFVDPSRGRKCYFYPYAVHNYHLSFLIKNDLEVRAEWEACPKFWHRLPSMMQSAANDIDTPNENLISEMTAFLDYAPVHKLNHRDKRFLEIVKKVRLRTGLS